MPEGDSLFKAAASLHAALAGQKITRFSSPLPALKEQGVVGRVVTRVRAHGKHVVMELDDGRALLSFLRMQGRWRIDAKARLPAWRRERIAREPRWDDELTTLIIETPAAVAVLERAALAELAPLSEIERRLASLGPDLLQEDFDLERARLNLRTRPELSIAEALLVQSLVAGIGNVYKSEVLFLERVDPFASVGSLPDDTLERVLRRARELMRRNRSGGRRTTFGSLAGSAYYVYERSGQHCLKCDAPIRMRRQGTLQRSTYFCASCQGVAGAP